MLCDVLSELPIVEETRPANVIDSQVIIPQLGWARDRFAFDIGAVIADLELDSARVLSSIIQDLKAKPGPQSKKRERRYYLERW